MHDFLQFSLVLALVLVLVRLSGKLTGFALVTSGILAIYVYAGAGLQGTAVLLAFFVMGVAATSWKKKRKQALRLTQRDQDARDEKQVLANGGIAGILGLLAWNIPQHAPLFVLMLTCSLSAAAADTVSSETGMILGRRFYNIVSWEKDQCGENGVISLEGTMAGLAASCAIALVYSCWRWDVLEVFIIIIAGTFGNLIDSLLGATLERRGWISNNAVNLANTLAGAIMGALCYTIL